MANKATAIFASNPSSKTELDGTWIGFTASISSQIFNGLIISQKDSTDKIKSIALEFAMDSGFAGTEVLIQTLSLVFDGEKATTLDKDLAMNSLRNFPSFFYVRLAKVVYNDGKTYNIGDKDESGNNYEFDLDVNIVEYVQ